MPLQLNVQFNIVMYSVLAGVLTGILFDIYRILRGVKIPKVIIVIEDLLFWSLCTLIIFTFLLYTNYAFLGVYVYIFIFIALALYFKIFSRFVVMIENRIGKIIFKVFRVAIKTFLYPFRVILKKMGNKNR
ncbi:spore cortex biosynthesis protein YabQ [Clostridium vincentii]|uniref:Spore cortex protein YabQ n=1 Tax=Clostridium vincentii TaxID=52704 RepID=A0A2T0BHH0_9CLOT|nr:spore cortex biosynthesis protein YabQ [Clostridium vincentii]PRR83330.1 Spore cortex protein YabQ [Clostridium vincentii]